MKKIKLRYRFLSLVPSALKRYFDFVSFSIERFVQSASEEIPPKAKVLDAGAGEGKFKKFFNKHRYISIDTTLGDREWDYSNLNIAGDLRVLPFASNSFDAVLCTQVLEHVKDPAGVLAELFRVLKDGGCLYLSTPQGWGIHQAPHDYFRFTSFALEHLLKERGFKIVYINPGCGYFSYLANRLTVFPKVLFWPIKNLLLRILLFPFELISYLLFVVILPFLLNLIDSLDRKRDYTLNYFVKAVK